MPDQAPQADEYSVASIYAEMLARAPENDMRPRLEPMQLAMEVLGDPQRSAPVIHVGGTNGKTSTARMIEAGLLAHDLRVGRYSSPHMGKVTERIAVDGKPVSDETFVRVWDEIRPSIGLVDAQLSARGEKPLTLFELLTVLAFAVFADAPVDVMVLEVGLGGSWDATNVADSAVQVIGPISLDHTAMLGETVEEIAQEKAGTIKPGGFLISAAQEPAAAQVLLEAAQAAQVPFRFAGVEFGVESRLPGVGGQQVTVQGLVGRYPELQLPLLGAHQAENFALAVAALEAFIGGGQQELNIENLRTACEHIVSPGRLETLRSAPAIIVDAAHNPAGIEASAAAVQESYGVSKLVLIIGILQEKDAAAMLQVIFDSYGDLASEVCFTESTSPRAIPAAELAELALDAGFREDQIHTTEQLDEAIAWSVARIDDEELSETGGILITGSITLVGEARALFGAVDTGIPDPEAFDPGIPDLDVPGPGGRGEDS
ncbi:bifunctional folylpolyglutamate synthase/dihydrofolate synthase [Nesterenkonia alkaliphila]|uniref:tetrahydrofolate synthase n=1 Tax=Nesterenkonia alkaliphila TaxID=1463631 RepID=A0A7K1UE64_9MICC|nr:folylpolyglutamate synthase/dihydrofolate synthase family protein [Nesterenkonia alkaliphila]MVT24770.1 dihydrofolate synthase [Nesterenkonia alkaliphila]GFZ95832.1 dihydrofolate synthase [Nesterenkonia alkaliphila]